jgi:amino acid adenylation domain-containing protein
MSAFPADLANLSPEARRELLGRLLSERAAASPAVLSPCSYGQRSLWFMHQLSPMSVAYNVSVAWRIRSAMDEPALHRAFAKLVARHEPLRTTYESRDGEPWQRVHEVLPGGYRTQDVPACSEAELSALVHDDAAQPFDLATGPILRATLFTRAADDHVLLVVIHHIASDLWSTEQMMSDLRALYLAESQPDASVVPPAPLSTRYSDFTTWQRAMLDGPEGEAHWQYWRTVLSGTVPRLELPTDRPRPAIQSFAGDGVTFPIPSDLADALRDRARAEQATLFALFLAAFQTLLIRYSGQDDILVGSISSGRSRHEFEPIVGYFVNPIMFRCDASADPTFRELLQRTRRDALAALDHQDYPFPLLVERLNVARDPSRSPLADAYFVWDRTRDAAEQTNVAPGQVHLDWQGTSLESLQLTQVGTPSDLSMVVYDMGGTLSASIAFSTDLFDRATIERFAEHYVAVLRAVAADPDVAISRLRLTTDAEREALLAPSKPAPLPSLDAQTLHARFAAQARRRPEGVAVSGASGAITYRELDERANGIAALLRAAGVAHGDLVGLYFDRDVAMISALLGILTCGAAYLPIDRAYPDERVAFMLEDSGAVAVLTERSLSDALPGVSLRRLFVDDALPTAAPATVAASGPDDLAYVIYTSGSTGRPKGVMVTHRNVMRLFDATEPWYAFSENDVWSLFHSIAFDFSVWEVWGALLHGGRVVVVPFAITRSADAFLDLLARERVTMLSQTPSAFRQLIAADGARPAPLPLSLRTIVFGGEALDVNVLRPWFERRGDEQPRLVNMYGITETTVHTTYRPITRADLNRRVRSPIGVPIPDLQLLVLDPAGQPVPIGVPGELYVGGDGVARGYLNRPELTTARFLAHPDSPSRLYRSGDLVRRLPDGDIEYIGRIDHQVKVRGFRIELGEIEVALSTHPSVDACAVIIRPDATGDPRIIAYVVLRPTAELSSADLQAFVRRSLPDYMVPGAFVRLPALPLTSNHKLDVNALPAVDQIESASSRPFVPPATPTERAIAVEWQGILGVEQVGLHDDFFELGGHSILATSLARRMRDLFQVDFPVYAVFEAPTVADMARRIDPLVGQPPGDSREEFVL